MSVLNRLNKNLSARSKMLLLVSIFVLIPLLVLIYVQFLSLAELENKSRAAYKENLRHTLGNVEKNIEKHFEQKFSKILTPPNQFNFPSEQTEKEIEEYFSNVKKGYPEIKSLFFVQSYHSDDITDKDFAYFYSDSFSKIDISMHTEGNHHRLLHIFETAAKKKHFINGNKKLLFLEEKKDCCDITETYIFNSLNKIKKKSKKLFVAAIVDVEYIKHNHLGTIAEDTLKNSTSPSIQSDIAFQISDKNQNKIYSNVSESQTYIHETKFSAPFQSWKSEIGLKNTDINSIARAAFWKNLLIMLSVVTFLILGLFLMIRATNREVLLAQAKSDFVSNVSHELKTPLSLIRLFVEMLELGYVKNGDKVHEYHRVINDESRRLSHLIDNILDFSKIESGNRVYNFESSNIGEIVTDVLSKYQYHIDKVGFKLKTNIENDIPSILLDRDAIAQSVINLIDNAIKYSTEIKEITVEVKNQTSYLTIEVVDCGKGITKEDQKKIFEKFFRVTDGLIHDVKGSGLGLSLVKHIVEAHQGKISVESKIDKGSRFIIRLPINAETSSQKTQKPLMHGGYKIAEDTNN